MFRLSRRCGETGLVGRTRVVVRNALLRRDRWRGSFRGCGLRQAAAFQEGRDVGIAAGEVLEQLQGVVAAATGEKGFAEVIAVLALQAAVLFHPLDAIRIE